MKNILKLIPFFTVLINFNSITIGQTFVSGGIYTNTTWTVANSPYIVTDTVVLFPNLTLIIEPGVTVKFDSSKFIEIRSSRIYAIGNATDSITFTSNSASPSLGIYNGIFLNGCLDFNFSYCNILFANVGISIDTWGTSSEVIQNSNFRFNYKSIYGPGSNHTVIQDCYFSDNTFGIGYVVPYTLIQNCRIINNQNGIGTIGLAKIQYCVIDSNSNIGINASDGDSILHNEIKYNGTGIKLDGGNTMSIINGNQIENNNIGIDILNTMNKISCNKICSNSIFDIKYEDNVNSNILKNNYWCTTDSTTIASHIYDGYDDITLGLLPFIPIDTIQCYITGCNVLISGHVTNATCDTCHDGHAYAIVTNAFQPITYTWNSSPLQTTQTATGLSPGNYTVCVSDANGCTSCTTVFVDSTNCTGFMLNAHATNATCSTCNDGSTSVSVGGGTAPYQYTWYTSPIQNTATATGLTQGNYTVCVTDLYGCTACDSATVSIGNCSAHFNIYPDTISHHYYAVNMASGSGPLSYSWSWGDGSSNDTIPFPDHTYSTAGFYTICLAITDSAGCTNNYCQSFYMMRNTSTMAMVYISVRPQAATEISENITEMEVSLFPNPVSNYLNIILPNNKSNSIIKIYNVTGEMLIVKKTKEIIGTIDVSVLTEGVYILEISDGINIGRRIFVKN